MTNYLTTTIATSTYQPISAMTNYLTTSIAATTYQPINNLIYLSGSTAYTLSSPYCYVYQVDLYSSNITITLPSFSSLTKGIEFKFLLVNNINNFTLTINTSINNFIILYNLTESNYQSTISFNNSNTYITILAYNINNWYVNCDLTHYQPISLMTNYLTTTIATTTYQPKSLMTN